MPRTPEQQAQRAALLVSQTIAEHGTLLTLGDASTVKAIVDPRAEEITTRFGYEALGDGDTGIALFYLTPADAVKLAPDETFTAATLPGTWRVKRRRPESVSGNVVIMTVVLATCNAL